MRDIKIKSKILGAERPVLIVAEIGMNHDGDLDKALAMIESASDCGADAVKFQMHIAEAETLKDAPPPPYFTDEPRYDYFKRTAFTVEEWKQLKQRAEDLGRFLICSSFSIEATEILDKEIGVEVFKVPSGEVTNLPYLEDMAKRGKPIILSSGMSSWKELDEAVELIKKYNDRLIILQCSSEYPCSNEDVGLNVMEEIKKRYQCLIGLSDHSLTIYPSFAAAVLGASVIERHFTLSKEMYGPDAKYALSPQEFRQLVEGIRAIETVLKNPIDKDDVKKYSQMKQIFQKSLVTRTEILQDTAITREMLTAKKPGTGIPSKLINQILGKRTKRNLPANHLINFNDLYE